MSTTVISIEQLAINTIRTLSMDAVQQAKSGHPGTPMALAPVVYTLWNEFLRYDPAQPNWMGRDRFVLSCGHASMLLYSILHLTNVRAVDESGQPQDRPSISLDAIRKFRQLGSPCAGHPEYGGAAGIEMTTGPLGQGVGASVGMAAAASWLSARYDRPGFELFGFNVFTLCSDGDLMEGMGCEAASLAGHLRLPNLCWIYDDNRITIEGSTELAFSEDIPQRFEALGWNVIQVTDANNLVEIQNALRTFQLTNDRPTLVAVRSIIGYGSPNKADSHESHGAPLGEEEVTLTKGAYGWPTDEKFLVPKEVREHFSAGISTRGRQLRQQWDTAFVEYATRFGDLAEEIKHIEMRTLPSCWDANLPSFEADSKGLATRASSGKVLNAVAEGLPWFLGGSADLAPSNNTRIKESSAGDFSASNYLGRNLHFGVREHAMAAIGNGMALIGLRPYVGTFFVFSDYLRPALRLSAMMRQPVLYVFTHDSIGLGEDGPTHQPVEHLAACRTIPGLIVARPADANEVTEIYRAVVSMNDQPTALVLTRQGLPTLDRRNLVSTVGAHRGAYVLSDPDQGEPDVILIGTGSEVVLCVAAQEQLATTGIRTRVVSMPSWELFEQQDESYRQSVLPDSMTARVAVEAGICQGWERYLGTHGCFIGMSSFGESAPYQALYQHFGITSEKIVSEVKTLLS